MPVYHSSFNDAQATKICGALMLPVKTKVKGPAPPARADDVDIVDEAIDYFRANVLFRNFQSEGGADLVLCYLTIYIGEMIAFWASRGGDKTEARKNMTQISMSGNFPVPGDKSFCLGGFFAAPSGRAEADSFRNYFRQLREETANRLLDIVYNQDGTKNKWWFQFSKRKFMNIAKTT